MPTQAPTVASASINAAGTTLTILFTEADSPPVLPATRVTGFTLSGTSATIASGTISGTTGTFVLSGLVYQGQTVTLNYASTGNVTDSASPPNPLAAFSGKAVTNNCTQNPTISGQVTLSGARIAGATIVLVDRTAGTVTTTTTDANGEYSFTVIAGHIYHACAEYSNGGAQYNSVSESFLSPN